MVDAKQMLTLTALGIVWQLTYKPDLWLHVGDPTVNVGVKVSEDLDKMKEYDFLTYMPLVSDDDDDDDDDDEKGEEKDVLIRVVMTVMTVTEISCDEDN
jgi:hypothetical protein